MVDFLLVFFGESVSLRIRQDPTILLDFTRFLLGFYSKLGSIVPLFQLVKNKKCKFFWNHFGFSGGGGGTPYRSAD